MSHQSEVMDDDGNVTHIRETSDDGRESILYEYDDSVASIITGDHRGDAVEVSDHNEDGTTRAYEYENSIVSIITGDHRGDEKSESKGGCFLTTACIKARELPDDCFELRTLRNFRDNILILSQAGKKEVEEYYRVAPSIVEAVNKNGRAPLIWNKVYADIKRAVTLVRKKKFQDAFDHYKIMTLRLKGAYF